MRYVMKIKNEHRSTFMHKIDISNHSHVISTKNDHLNHTVPCWTLYRVI